MWFIRGSGMSVSHLHPAAGAHGHELGFLRKYIFSEDHKIIGIQFLFSGLIFFCSSAAPWPCWSASSSAGPPAPFPILGRWFPASWGGQMSPEFYTMLFTHARHGDDLLRHHPAPDRGVRQLPDPADDRGQRHGLPQAEHAVVLVHVAGVHRHPRQLLRGRRRRRLRLDLLSDPVQRPCSAGPGLRTRRPRRTPASARSSGSRPCSSSASRR